MSKDLNDPGAVLTGAKQTMASWSKVIESYETVPTIYKNIFKTQFPNNQQFPYTLLTPSLVKPGYKTNEKLVCDANDAIHILERNRNQVTVKNYPYQKVYMVEAGSILLCSWLTISGILSTGMADISTIDFNTANTRHFETFFNKLRPTPQSIVGTKSKAEKDKFDYLSTLNFKLMNFGRSSLVCGETVIQILLQHEIRQPIWAMLGSIFLQTIAPAHLTILTSHELILIQDIAHGRKVQEPQYGGIWQYIPLHSIKAATWSETGNGWLTFSVKLTSNKMIEKLFAVSSKPELDQLCAKLQQMT